MHLIKIFRQITHQVTKIILGRTDSIDIAPVNKKAIIALTFVVLYGFALVRPAFPLIEYYVKLDVYLKNCVNREKPELHCNGQCILMQKLKAFNHESQAEAPPAPVKVNLQEYPIGFIQYTSFEALTPVALRPGYARPDEIPSDAFFAEIFHPPSIHA